ncbi:MAG TPA: 5-oxoprolinase subunit PxpB, partial [Anaerolineae bacterium]
MTFAAPRLRLAGEAAVLVEWGNEISPEANARVFALAEALAAAGVPGIVEMIPAYCSLLVEYDFLRLGLSDLAALIERSAASGVARERPPAPVREIPVRYGGEDGPDLAEVAARNGLSAAQVIAAHCRPVYRVYMLGFSPGFAYMGTVPAEIATPRLATPRTHVPAGSVGIAGQQTGIYPQAAPGGWHLLGRTDAVLFDPYRSPPALLAPGDRVRFMPLEGAAEEQAARRVESYPSEHESVPLPPGAGEPLFEVLAPGWLSALQDLGRRGYQRFGVPVAGAMDPVALQAANSLLGNPHSAAAIEITLGGLVLRVLRDTPAALCGAGLNAVIRRVGQGPWSLPSWTELFFRRDSVLEFGGPKDHGCRAYLAVPGGFAVVPVMGSAATYLPGKFGGLAGRALATGDLLAADERAAGVVARATASMLPRDRRPSYGSPAEVRVIFGPHDDYFADEARATLLAGTYQVSGQSDRMG